MRDSEKKHLQRKQRRLGCPKRDEEAEEEGKGGGRRSAEYGGPTGRTGEQIVRWARKASGGEHERARPFAQREQRPAGRGAREGSVGPRS